MLALIVPSPGWAGHGAPPGVITTLRADHVKRLTDAGEPLVPVDLRKSDDYRAGHLPGAISLPITELERRFREIPQRGRVVLYCQCPSEDLISVFLFLRSQGYSNHAILDEGFDGWLRRNYPVAK